MNTLSNCAAASFRARSHFMALILAGIVAGACPSSFAGPSSLASQAPPPALPAGIQVPFVPDAELLARLQQGGCWSEFRLYDPQTQTLGETIALEWYDKLDQSVPLLYLRQDSFQVAFRRLSVRYTAPGSKQSFVATGEQGPEVVGTRWTATYSLQKKLKGTAVMRLIEASADNDEHVSVGVLTLHGVFALPVNVAHSAGCRFS